MYLNKQKTLIYIKKSLYNYIYTITIKILRNLQQYVRNRDFYNFELLIKSLITDYKVL